MNQILYQCNFNQNNSKHVKNKLLIIIFSAIFLIIIAFCIYFFAKYKLLQNEKISKNLVSNFNIMTLYSNTIDSYSTADTTTLENTQPFVIGLIQIDEIGLTYPILSSSSEELLKISPCRFYGPMPNEIGNLCIAGHNYVDNKQFGKIHYLKLGNIIKIFDLNGNFVEYSIYDKREISADDLSCTKQETNGLKEITLITCNNVKGNRVCIKAREKGD